jgi:hypothetical protein
MRHTGLIYVVGNQSLLTAEGARIETSTVLYRITLNIVQFILNQTVSWSGTKHA